MLRLQLVMKATVSDPSEKGDQKSDAYGCEDLMLLRHQPNLSPATAASRFASGDQVPRLHQYC